MRLERRHVVSCSISGLLLLAVAANIMLTGMAARAPQEALALPLVTGSVIYLPGLAQESAELVYHGQTSDSLLRIALTFDSGWIHEYTPALLNILRDHGVVATFFHRGKWAEAHPELVKRMVEEGHLIGNHSYTHPYMDKLSLAAVAQEITQADLTITGLVGYKPWLYRPPYGACSPMVRKVLAEQGYTHSVMWSIDTHDWKDPGVEYIVNRVINNAKDGAIVLLHVGAPQTVVALPRIITMLRDRDFDFVPLDELLPPKAAADGLIPYRVRAGDTLESVGQRFQVTREQILELNPAIIEP